VRTVKLKLKLKTHF